MKEMTNAQIASLIQQLVIAKLRSDSYTVEEIAKKIGRSKTAVRKAINKAPHGRFEYRPQIPSNCPLDENKIYEMVDNHLGTEILRREMRKIANDSLLRVDTVVDRKEDRDEHRGFSVRTGVLLGRLLDRSRTAIGLTWGNHLRPVAMKLPGINPRSVVKGDEPLPFIPLCSVSEGEKTVTTRGSTIIATRFNRMYNADFDGTDKEPKTYNLNGLPLSNFIFSDNYYKQSSETEKRRIREIRKFVAATHSDGNLIFGKLGGAIDNNPDLIVNTVDTIITSAGPTGAGLFEHLDRWFPDRQTIPIFRGPSDRIKKSDLVDHHAVGDIAGILLPRPGENYELNKSICEDVNTYLSTLRSGHLQNLRNKTIKAHTLYENNSRNRKKNSNKKTIPPAAGVIGIFTDLQQIEPMLAALSEGYLSRVIMTKRMENELVKRLDELNEHEKPYSIENLMHI